ncbi:MAG: TRAP transporter substrate-binding protein [Bacillota bacterium]|jgi:tripartite ATP-independent transporter DctP family solute receptor
MIKKRMFLLFTLGILMSIPVIWAVDGAAANNAQFRFVAGTMHPAEHPYNIALKYMADQAAKRSKGRVKIDIYMNGQLGSETEMLQNMMMGKEINLLNVSCGNIAPLVSEMDFFALPYLFGGWDKFERAMNGDVGEIIKGLLAKRDLVVIGMFNSGDRLLLSTKKKIMSPEDMKGIKMRVWESPIVVETWKAQGAVPVVIAFAEAYTALQTGVVQAAENAVTGIYLQKWYESAKYIALTHHLYMPDPLMIPRKVWIKLPKDIQKLMVKLGKKATTVMIKEQMRVEKEYLEELSKKGIEIYDVNRKPFVEATRPLVEKFANKRNLNWIYDVVKKYQ